MCCSYDAVKNVKPAKEWRDEECEVSSRSQFDGAHLVISKTVLGDAGTYRYSPPHSSQFALTVPVYTLNFPKLHFNFTKLPPHLSISKESFQSIFPPCSSRAVQNVQIQTNAPTLFRYQEIRIGFP